MFTTATSLSNLNVPRFETRKALIVINLQNDSFYQQDDVFICKNRDFVEEIKTLVPYFRNTGDIVWVRTEISLPAASSSTSSRTEEEMAKQDTKNRHEQEASEQQLEDDTGRSEPKETKTQYVGDKKMTQKGAQTYHPLSHVKSMESRASAQARADHRSANRSILKDNTNIWEEKLAKSRKGQQPKFYVAGTPGAEMLDGLKAFVDDERDMTVIKQFYSAFDQTSLLMSLRMRLVTELYICGCFTNVGVYATAVDAVQHGFEVNIVEDCVGFRSEDKHDEAMRQMADVLGVNGTDSEEIIEELGGRAPPDAAEPMFSGPGPEGISLRDLSLAAGQSKVVPGRGTPNWKNAKIIKGHPSKEAESKASVNTRITRTSTGRGTGDNSSAEQTVELVAEQSQVEQPFELNPLPALGASCSKSRKFLPSASSYMKPGDNIGTGDSRILHKVLSSPLSDDAFQLLGEEVDWQTMHHRGGEVPRLVAVQGQIGKDGSVPLYRHPADESPPLLRFSPTVERIRRVVEEAVKQPLNHVLIQLYRDGIDNISEHSDKTLDIVRGSNIINLSLGAQRVMTLRTKKVKRTSSAKNPDDPRQTQRIPLPHNSAFVLGPQTNAYWLHGVRADKRPEQQKNDEERSYKGQRISITFRHIGTFMDERKRKIWGQGARSKAKPTAGDILRNNTAEMEAMIVAFGKENHQSDFDWDTEYGRGFDVVNLIDDTPRR